MTVGVNVAGMEQIQPSLDGNTLYWTGNAYIWNATLTSPGASLSSAGSWSARTQLLGPAPNHQILGVGEPNVAHVAGTTELYFVYAKKTATGYDSNVGKIVFRQ
jgi:hypothetical protein